ncbi:hypothetical protein [Rosenbergiella collisarenosi]|uniref:hypothetical protein n=1 Tax=Rosenbergiella collisarenosi TaxID=1544695 RepID=UPI001F504108|nr:hypothetical protein [Rosenbergiella collisarenosi]
MKICYFYPSSAEIEYPEIKELAPSSAIMAIDVDTFPKNASIALNFAVACLPDEAFCLVRVDPYFEGKKKDSIINEYQPFRSKEISSTSGISISRYSVIEPFSALEEGLYTFKMYIFREHPGINTDDLTCADDTSECSVLISRGLL